MNSPWIKIWETILLIGFGSFSLLVLAVIPLGAMDIVKLFRSMDEENSRSNSSSDSIESPIES